MTTMPTTVLHVVFKRHKLVLHHFVDNLQKGLNVCSWKLVFRILSLFLNNSTDLITLLEGCWSTQGRLITKLNEFVMKVLSKAILIRYTHRGMYWKVLTRVNGTAIKLGGPTNGLKLQGIDVRPRGNGRHGCECIIRGGWKRSGAKWGGFPGRNRVKGRWPRGSRPGLVLRSRIG